jgi:fumarylacetoacetate (FAA) hydrolase
MKLATINDGSRDGQLAVVSRDLKTAHFAQAIAPTLQRALDDWDFIAPQLEDLYQTLNHARARHSFTFDANQCLAPLPRAYQWADGSAYLNHVDLVRKSRAAEMPPSYWHDPLMYQGGSDDFIGPTAPAYFSDEAWGIDFEAELAIIAGDTPMGSTPAQAGEQIRLVMLLNDWSLRNLIPDELTKGFGFFHGKPATAFAPVAVTPNELGDAWHDFKVHLPVLCHWNEKRVGRAEAGEGMEFNFAQLLAHACKTRNARAGTIIGSGTVSNKDSTRGYSCIAESRAIETIASGAPSTEYMKFGDRIKIEVLGLDKQSIFGALNQTVLQSRSAS